MRTGGSPGQWTMPSWSGTEISIQFASISRASLSPVTIRDSIRPAKPVRPETHRFAQVRPVEGRPPVPQLSTLADGTLANDAEHFEPSRAPRFRRFLSMELRHRRQQPGPPPLRCLIRCSCSLCYPDHVHQLRLAPDLWPNHRLPDGPIRTKDN